MSRCDACGLPFVEPALESCDACGDALCVECREDHDCSGEDDDDDD